MTSNPLDQLVEGFSSLISSDPVFYFQACNCISYLNIAMFSDYKFTFSQTRLIDFQQHKLLMDTQYNYSISNLEYHIDVSFNLQLIISNSVFDFQACSHDIHFDVVRLSQYKFTFSQTRLMEYQQHWTPINTKCIKNLSIRSQKIISV